LMKLEAQKKGKYARPKSRQFPSQGGSGPCNLRATLAEHIYIRTILSETMKGERDHQGG